MSRTTFIKCPVCGTEMEQGYVPIDTKCDICGRNTSTNYYCPNDHHICNHCRFDQVFSAVKNICMTTKSRNPIDIAEMMMDAEDMSILGCKQNLIAALAVYTAYKNSGGRVINFEKDLEAIKERVSNVQISMCKLGGFCGIPLAMGGTLQAVNFESKDIAEVTKSANKLSGLCMTKLMNPNNEGSYDCCIRNSAVCIAESAKFINNYFWIEMELPDVMICKYHDEIIRCNKDKCPFYHGRRTDKI